MWFYQGEKKQIDNLGSYLNKLKTTESQVSKRKDILKTKAEINEIKNTIQEKKTNETRSYFFKKSINW